MPAYACEINALDAELHGPVSISDPQNGTATLQCQIVADDIDILDNVHFDDPIEIFEDGDSIFSGQIVELAIVGLGGEIVLSITAHSQNALATRRYIIGLDVPAGTTKAAATAIAAYIPGVSIDPLQDDGPSIEAFTISKQKPQDALNYLTQVSGLVWRIRGSYLRLLEPGSESAPFDIDAAAEEIDGDLKVIIKRNDYANRVIVIGSGVTATAEDLVDISDNGPWELLVEASDVTTQAAADALAAAALATKMIELKEIEYATQETGLWSGQSQIVVLPSRGLNGPFLFAEVDLDIEAELGTRVIKAVEGSVWQTGWREDARQLFSGGGGRALSIGGTGGGGVTIAARRYAYPIGAEQTTQLRAKTAGEWVRVSPMPVWLDAGARNSTTARVSIVMKSWFNSDLVLQARLVDAETGTVVRGTSTTVSAMDWTPRIFTATGITGNHPHYLEVQPSISEADEPTAPPDFGVMGYVE